MQKLDDYDIANKSFQESLIKKATLIKEQIESEKLVEQLEVMKVQIDIQRAEAIQLIQAVDGKQCEKLGKFLHAVLTYAENRDIQQYKKCSMFNVKRGNIKTRISTFCHPTAYNFEKEPNWTQKCARLPWPVNSKNLPNAENIWSSRRNNQNHWNLQVKETLS